MSKSSGNDSPIKYTNTNLIFYNTSDAVVGGCYAGAWTFGADAAATTLTSVGFTALGTGNTGLKCKVLSGTTNAAEGGSVALAHGVTSSKIVSISAIVFYDSTSGVTVGQPTGGYVFAADFNSTYVNINNNATSSENILSKPCVVTVWYTA